MVDRDEFVAWLVEGLRSTRGDLGELARYVELGARKYGRLPIELYSLLPIRLGRVYAEALAG